MVVVVVVVEGLCLQSFKYNDNRRISVMVFFFVFTVLTSNYCQRQFKDDKLGTTINIPPKILNTPLKYPYNVRRIEGKRV